MTEEIFNNSTIEAYRQRLNDQNKADFQPQGLNRLVWKERDPENRYDISQVSIKFDHRTGEVKVRAEGEGLFAKDFEPTEAEAEAIKQAIAAHPWPVQEHIDLSDPKLPDLWQLADDSCRWAFHDADGNVVMLQVRKDEKGEKVYIPITRYGGEYLFQPPLGENPLFNLHLIKKLKVSTVFIHEGGAAAAAAQKIADDARSQHPWRAELAHAAHLGFIGGAYATGETDFDELKRLGVTTVYVVPDNDTPGRNAGQKIARKLGGTVYTVLVGSDFPTGWDFADEMPGHLFNRNGLWTGPTFASCVFPTTWATYQYVDDNGKNRWGLRREFAAQWYWVNDEAMVVHRQFPHIYKTEKGFNDYIAPYSDVPDTADRLKKIADSSIDATVYRPGDKGGGVKTEGNRRVFNVYREHDFPAMDGDATLWLEFIDHLLPDPKERQAFLRWFYTMIASPATRTYSCLMFSEAQGSGKTTVSDILYRIIGPRNATIANSKSLDSQFNSQWENRRLVIFQELYEGGSNFRTTNALKTVLTDDHIRINAKYRQERTVENHTHILAASNSAHALDLDDGDRRWLVVQATNEIWPQEKFRTLREWLFDDIGCNVILGLARKFGDYLQRGERPPVTAAKNVTIWRTESDIVLDIEALHERFENVEVAFETKAFQSFITGNQKVQKSDSMQVNCQRMKKRGWGILTQRDDEFGGFRPTVKRNGSNQKVACIVSPALKSKMREEHKDKWSDMIGKCLANPADDPVCEQPF